LVERIFIPSPSLIDRFAQELQKNFFFKDSNWLSSRKMKIFSQFSKLNIILAQLSTIEAQSILVVSSPKFAIWGGGWHLTSSPQYSGERDQNN